MDPENLKAQDLLNEIIVQAARAARVDLQGQFYRSEEAWPQWQGEQPLIVFGDYVVFQRPAKIVLEPKTELGKRFQAVGEKIELRDRTIKEILSLFNTKPFDSARAEALHKLQEMEPSPRPLSIEEELDRVMAKGGCP